MKTNLSIPNVLLCVASFVLPAAMHAATASMSDEETPPSQSIPAQPVSPEELSGDRSPEEGARRPRRDREPPSAEEREALRKFREQTKDMSQEERRKELEKHPELQKFFGKRPPRPGREGKPAPNEQMQALSEEERSKLQELRSKLKDLSPEERRAELEKLPPELKEKLRGGRGGPGGPGDRPGRPGKGMAEGDRGHEIRERLKNLTPEERAQLHAFQEQSRTMTPEQRKEEAAKLPFFKDLSPEHKELLEKRLKHIKEMPEGRRKKVMENYKRWRDLSPEDREKMREKMRNRRPEPQQQT
jgi:hypothetical protein